MTALPHDISINDIIAFAWFLICWSSYSWLGKYFQTHKSNSLHSFSKYYRTEWMRQALKRNNRITDAALLANLMRSVAFFASTSIFILGGLIAILSSVDQAIIMVKGIPFSLEISPEFWKLKVLLLIFIYIYIFFKLVWSIRQYNTCVIILGAAPEVFPNREEQAQYSSKLGLVMHRAATHYNEGMRGYEYGLAVLAWFVHPVLFIFSTSLILVVIYRREFASQTVRAMQEY
ncbi:MAG: DUF599 domain-containing protein [Cocleimonas sp.]|nr:DUF599 domain-containing protein [Cocleimonas sp.]